jgi:hypothetical protein
MRTILRGTVLALIGASIFSNAALAKKPTDPSSTYRFADTITIPDEDEAMLLGSDGAGPYLAGEVQAAYVHDFAPSVPDESDDTDSQDHIYFSTGFDSERFTYFNNELASVAEFGPAGALDPIRCLSSYAFFESGTTPDWFETLGGEPVTGWGTVGCYTSETTGYHAVFPRDSGALGTGNGQCLWAGGYTSVTLYGPVTGRVQNHVDPECYAEIYSFDTSSGEWEANFLGLSEATVWIDLQLPTGDPDKPGKGPKPW